MPTFFKFIHPLSKTSSIRYRWNHDRGVHEFLEPTPDTYREDKTVSQQLGDAFTTSMSFSEAIDTTYELIVGNHYDNSLLGARGKELSKGVLDFTLLPLIARKLSADAFYIPEEMSDTAFILSLALAIPIELGRFSVGISLTIALIPVVAILHFAKETLNYCLEQIVPQI